MAEATIFDGVEYKREILSKAKTKVEEKGLKPGLAIVKRGDDDIFFNIVKKDIKEGEVRVEATNVSLAESATADEVVKKIESLNNNGSIHGIVFEIPIDLEDPKLREEIDQICDAIAPDKDIEGLRRQNYGSLSRGSKDAVCPFTVKGCMDILKQTGVSVAGKKVVVVGRRTTPCLAFALDVMWKDAIVTVVSPDNIEQTAIEAEVKQADILLVSIQKPHFIKGSWIKPEAIVIDGGFSLVNGKTVGDVEFEIAKTRASFITPVPGGVGPTTIANLILSVVEAAVKGQAAQ